MSDVAFAAGFASVRTFNETVLDVFALAPTELRARAAHRHPPATSGSLVLRLPFRAARSISAPRATGTRLTPSSRAFPASALDHRDDRGARSRRPGRLRARRPGSPARRPGPLPATAEGLTGRATAWRPWRAYPVQYLWATCDHAMNRLPA
ncbi:MAG: hypothetical protein JO063_02100 [Pseudonocardiales bacterium]|nr:hypothetical protein [Pseudonocardiales bacterium]MBV9031967.1 hypothetical protein [Pseudonocardiales bacterium]MBW0008907.1 hypothetical protein [Pseudonocardiales bacterium]